MPAHNIALKLIKAAGVPIAAPSANRSGRPSPTTAKHVLTDLRGRIPLILDGGKCKVGVESTVISLIGTPTILRPGHVTQKQLQNVIGKVAVHSGTARGKVSSPGMKYRHYAPKAKVVLTSTKEITNDIKTAKGKVGVLTFGKCNIRADVNISLGATSKSAAQRLFAALRAFDDERVNVIFVTISPKMGLAVLNRLRRASKAN